MARSFRLDETTVLSHLSARGVLHDAGRAVVHTLAGGVSGTVILVESGRRRWVVKQALAQLRVQREWLANPVRTVVEARGLRLAAEVIPNCVPEVVDIDPATNVLVMIAAPAGTTDWKGLLMTGRVDAAVGLHLGELLGRLHAGLRVGNLELAELDRVDLFEELRVAPYFRSLVADHTELSATVMPHVDRMFATHECLVHGDFSPKNVLVGGRLLWLLDFEVAHVGDPAFDLAFMLTHLLMKGLHLPRARPELLATALEFLAGYARTGPRPAPAAAHIGGLTGCLLLARVDGRSPAEYLTEPERVEVRRLGIGLAGDPPTDLSAMVTGALP